MYLYNVEAQMFINQGNSWGTQLSVDTKGLMIMVGKYIPASEESEQASEWDGVTYTFSDCRSGKWYNIFIDSDNGVFGEAYVDRASQANWFWSLEKQANGCYRIWGADLNPSYNHTNYADSYLGVIRTDGEIASTVAYPLISLEALSEGEEALLDWTFVTKETYEEYYNKVLVYEMAMTLKEKIDEGNGRGLDMSECETVFSNTSSTYDELNLAYQKALKIIADADEKDVTPDNPKDMTEYIVNPNFDNGVTGWTKEGAAKTFEANGWVPATVDGVMSAPALNLWGANQDINVHQTIVDLPNGIYKFHAGGYSQSNGPWFYANDAKTDVTTGGPNPYSVLTLVSDKTMTLGVAFPAEGTQWVMADCFRLEYFGNGYEAYHMWIEETLAASGSYDGVLSTQQLHDDYDAALEALQAAQTSEEIQSLLPSFLLLGDSIKANAAAYAEYKAAFDEAQGMIDSEKYAGDDFDFLTDYMMESEPCEDFPNGAAGYILANLLLSTEEIQAETEFLKTLISNAVKNGMAVGAEVTTLISNPNFSDGMNGWTYDRSLGIPSVGGLETNPNVERWNQNFDFYQDIELPNGVYELKVQAFYRTADNVTAYQEFVDGTSEILTQIYANGNEKEVVNIYSQAQPANFYQEDGHNVYTLGTTETEVPNSMKTSSEAFNAGLYENTVYGVVYNKVLRVGIHSLSASATDRWSIWDNFRLFYMGNDEAIISEYLTKVIAEAETLLNESASEEAMSALLSAIDEARVVTGGKNQLEAIASVKAAMEAYQQAVGIASVNVEGAQSSAVRYNLAGQMVGSDYKGIVIIGGKKYIAR